MNVQLCGFNLTPDIRMILSGLCRISTKREIQYKYDNHDAIEACNVLIVNGQDEDSVRLWNKHKDSAQTIPAILINFDEEDHSPNTYVIPRSSLGIKLLNLLDKIVNTKGVEQLQLEKNRREVMEKAKQAAQRSSASGEAKAAPYDFDSEILEAFSGQNSSWRKRALIIDDSASVRTQLKEFLSKSRIDADEAATAVDGMQKVRNKQYDVIFLDIVMPEMDGYKACKLIKKQKFAKDTPVVMLTSKSSTFNKARGILAGCDAYLTKPVKASLLKQVLWEKIEAYVYA
ncbi:MAG: response regulator [Acidiferrobacterales bacterium]|nr:response regulator [Acidiferrobacterales bacterium]